MLRINPRHPAYRFFWRASVFYNNRVLRSKHDGLSYSGQQYRNWLFCKPNCRRGLDAVFERTLGEKDHCRKAYVHWRKSMGRL